ncbi:UNVERIFIED_CONTAM: hypothetical protein K2H54_053942 [Gekko kuhli]
MPVVWEWGGVARWGAQCWRRGRACVQPSEFPAFDPVSPFGIRKIIALGQGYRFLALNFLCQQESLLLAGASLGGTRRRRTEGSLQKCPLQLPPVPKQTVAGPLPNPPPQCRA